MNDLVVKSIITVQHILGVIQERARQAHRGQGTVEYALILAFIALVVVAAVKLVGPAVANTFNNVTNTLNNSGTPVPGATPTP